MRVCECLCERERREKERKSDTSNDSKLNQHNYTYVFLLLAAIYQIIESNRFMGNRLKVWVSYMICCCPTTKSPLSHSMRSPVYQSYNYCKFILVAVDLTIVICHHRQTRLHCTVVYTFCYFIFFSLHRDLEGNQISFIDEDSFSGFLQLEDL